MIVRLWKGDGYRSLIIRSVSFAHCKFRNIKLFHGGKLHFNIQLLIFGFRSYNYGFELRLINVCLVYEG